VNAQKPYKALIFDSLYDLHRGAIIYVACFDGEIKKGDRITSFFSKKSYEVQEVGIARPHFQPTAKL
jgi:translation elongation factor EF-4